MDHPTYITLWREAPPKRKGHVWIVVLFRDAVAFLVGGATAVRYFGRHCGVEDANVVQGSVGLHDLERGCVWGDRVAELILGQGHQVIKLHRVQYL